MREPTGPVQTLRFGPFEVDLQARELRNRGRRVRLEEKPLQILELLLKDPGRLVSREEFCERLWSDASVGFGPRLNTAVNSLRRALGDSAVNPRFVQTRLGLGYRFIGRVEPAIEVTLGAPEPAAITESVAVLPVQNHGADPEVEVLCERIAECLVNCLSQMCQRGVVTWMTALRCRGYEVEIQVLRRDLNVIRLELNWTDHPQSVWQGHSSQS